MRSLLPLLLVAGLVGVAVLFLLSGDPGPGPVMPGPDDGAATTLAPPGPEAPADEDRVPEPVADPASERTSIEPDDAPQPAPEVPLASEGRARLSGRFLLPGGAPAAGVSVELRGFQANSTRVQQFGLPEDWTDPTATSGADGRFELRFDAPRAFQFFLDAGLDGHANESWRWGELSVTEDRDLGEVTLRQAGELEVAVVDAAGRPIPSGWRVLADAPASSDGGEGRDETRVSGVLDEAAGVFRLTGLPAGPVALKARHPLAGWIDGPPAEVLLDRIARAEVTYDGPDLSSRIEVSTFVRPYHILSGNDERVRLVGPGVDQEQGVAPGTSQSFHFDDLPPGSYTLSIDHPLFEPWSQSGVEPGSAVNAHLVPSGRLTLALTDAATGEPIPAATLRLRLDFKSQHSPNAFEIHSGPLPKDGLLPPVPPGDTTLIVLAEGYAELELPVLDLAPFETRALDVVLGRGAAITGTVRTRAGTTIAGAQVLLMPPGAPPAIQRTWHSSMDTGYVGALETAETDADGRFRFDRLAPGIYDVHAAGTPWLLASTVGLELAPGQVRDLDLGLPEGAGLDVHIPDAVGLPTDFQVVLVTEADLAVDQGPFGSFLDDVEGRTVLEATGPNTWSGRDLPPGPGHVLLGRGETVIWYGSSGSHHAGRKVRLGDVELEAGVVRTLDAELGERTPGEVLVEVLSEGLPQPGVRVRVDSGGALGGTAVTGPEGFALVTGVFPGEVQVLAQREGVGRFRAAGPVLVETARRSQVRVDTTVVAGRLRLVDAGGEPHRNKRVLLAGGGLSHSAETSADGRLDVLLRPGVVTVSLRHHDRTSGKLQRDRAELAWPPPNGEVELKLLPE